MKGTFSISKEDYFAFLLFEHSKSKERKRKLVYLWIKVMAGWIILMLIFYIGNYPLLTFSTFMFGIYYSVFFPFRQRRNYENHYKNYINDSCEYRLDKNYNIEITLENILMSNDTVETKINTSEISGISEIRKYFFINYKFGGALILRKDMFDYDNLLEELSAIAQFNYININKDLNWKWDSLSSLF